MATPFSSERMPQIPDPSQLERLAETSIYMKILDILGKDLNVDVMANAVNTLAGAINTLRQAHQQVKEQIPAQAQFELEVVKAKHKMALENAKFEHQKQMDELRLQHELSLKQQEASLKARQVQQQAGLKVVETQNKMQQANLTEQTKRDTMVEVARQKSQMQSKPNLEQSKPKG